MKIYIVTKTENCVQSGVIEHLPKIFFTKDEAIDYISNNVDSEVALGKKVREFFISDNHDIFIYDFIFPKLLYGGRIQYYIWENFL